MEFNNETIRIAVYLYLQNETEGVKKYGKIYNMKEALLFYRLHENQLTHNGGREGRSYWNKIRNNAIEKLINS